MPPLATQEIEMIWLPHLRGRGITTAATESTTELGGEVAGSTALLALTTLTASVTALTVATVTTATATESTLTTALIAEHAARGSVRPLLLDVGSGDNLSGEMEPLAEVVETLGGEGVVVVLPRELSLDVAAGSQRLASLDDEKVANTGLVGGLVVLSSDHDALTEEVLMDRLAIGLGNKHLGELAGVDTIGDLGLA